MQSFWFSFGVFMKYKFTFLSVVLLLSLFQLAQGQTNESDQTKLRGFAMGQTFQYDGREYNYELATDDVKDTPSWNSSNGEPPLSLPNALTIARDNLKRFVKNTDGWNVKTINLSEVDTQKWIYDISFSCYKRECVEKTNYTFNILVKMDGSVVEPEIKIKDKKSVR